MSSKPFKYIAVGAMLGLVGGILGCGKDSVTRAEYNAETRKVCVEWEQDRRDNIRSIERAFRSYRNTSLTFGSRQESVASIKENREKYVEFYDRFAENKERDDLFVETLFATDAPRDDEERIDQALIALDKSQRVDGEALAELEALRTAWETFEERVSSARGSRKLIDASNKFDAVDGPTWESLDRLAAKQQRLWDVAARRFSDHPGLSRCGAILDRVSADE